MNKEEQHDFGMQHGHSPVAHNVICVDFDATIITWGPLNDPLAKPMPGAVSAVRRLKELGYTVVIFTSRLSPSWITFAGEDADEQHAYVKRTLRRLKVPYDYITSEKVPAIAYVDDKAIEFTGDNWPEILSRIENKELT